MTDTDEWDPEPFPQAYPQHHESQDDDMHGAREAQRKRLIILSVIGGLLVAGGLGLTIWLLNAYSDQVSAEHRIDRLEEVDEERNNDLGRTITAIEDLRKQVQGLGAVPVAPPPEDLIGETGASDPDDPDPDDPEKQDPEKDDPEKQEAEVQEAEVQEEERQDPEINDDPVITFEELVAALEVVCADNACVGPEGPSGPAGADGANGTTTCPAGYHFQEITIPSQSQDTQQIFLVCAKDV